MTNSEKMWYGKVDRISGSGNAMVDRESTTQPSNTKSELAREVNLGPLPQDIVGEKVQFAYEKGTFGLCLDPQYIDDDYFREMRGRFGVSGIEIEPSDLISDVDIPDIVDSGDILLAYNFFTNPEGGMHIDIPDNLCLAKIGPKTGEEWNCLGVIENPVIQNEVPVPVEVTEVYPTYIETKGAFPKIENKLPNVGETIKTTTGPQTDMGTIAVYEAGYAIPVLIEDTQYTSGETLKLQITSIEDTHAIGEPVFSADDFDVIHISEDRLPYQNLQSQNQIISQGVPIDIKPIPEDAPTTSKLSVTGEGSDALVGRWNIQDEIDSVEITKGDEIELEIQSVDIDSCVGYYKQFPVRVNFNFTVPSEFKGENILISIQSVYPDKAIAEPIWITNSQGEFEVRVVGTSDNNTIAINEASLVRIPNSSVVSSGDKILVTLSESTAYDEPSATVSARPVFQNIEKPHLVRLPETCGEVTKTGGTLAVVDHLPSLDSAVTLGIAEVNEDHIVPTVTALPEAHIPDEGTYLSVEAEKTIDNIVVGVGEELPLKLPLYLSAKDDRLTARVLERSPESLFGMVGSVGGDAGSRLRQVYDSLQLAGWAIQEGRYEDGVQNLNEGLNSCPSDFPGFERLLSVQEKMILAIVTIRDRANLIETASKLSQEADEVSELNNDEYSPVEVSEFLSAREAEMRATERLLTALEEVDHDNDSNLQAIAQGMAAKDPAVKAAEYLRVAKERVADTPFSENIPSLEVRTVIQEFNEAFPGVVEELRPFDPPEEDADWFQRFHPERIIERTDAVLADTQTSGDTWQRPAVPETMGIVSMTGDVNATDTSMELSTNAQDASEVKKDSQSNESDAPDIGTTQTRQTKEKESKNNTTEADSLTNEHSPPTTVSEEQDSEQVTTTETSSNESNAETTTDEQSSATIDASGGEIEPTSTVDATPSVAEKNTAESGITDKPLPIPDDSDKLRELRKKAESEESENPEREDIETTASRYRRSPAVREYAIARADGTCELCGEAAPFVKENGDPFLEVHHVNELGEGGADHPSLVGAVCPNCHKEIHYGKRGDDLNEKLRSRLKNGLGDVGAVDE